MAQAAARSCALLVVLAACAPRPVADLWLDASLKPDGATADVAGDLATDAGPGLDAAGDVFVDVPVVIDPDDAPPSPSSSPGRRTCWPAGALDGPRPRLPTSAIWSAAGGLDSQVDETPPPRPRRSAAKSRIIAGCSLVVTPERSHADRAGPSGNALVPAVKTDSRPVDRI
jgi:hypothetical protein